MPWKQNSNSRRAAGGVGSWQGSPLTNLQESLKGCRSADDSKPRRKFGKAHKLNHRTSAGDAMPISQRTSSSTKVASPAPFGVQKSLATESRNIAAGYDLHELCLLHSKKACASGRSHTTAPGAQQSGKSRQF